MVEAAMKKWIHNKTSRKNVCFIFTGLMVLIGLLYLFLLSYSPYFFVNDSSTRLKARVEGSKVGVIALLDFQPGAWKIVFMPSISQDAYLDLNQKTFLLPSYFPSFPPKDWDSSAYRRIVPTVNLYFLKIVYISYLPHMQMGYPN